jgi:hypothetical protein
MLLGLYAEGHVAYTSKGAVAMLLLELYVRSGDEHWLRAAPEYLRAGGDALPAGEWQKLAEQARQRRAEFLAQPDDPNVCRDADGLPIRLEGDADLLIPREGQALLMRQGQCAKARELKFQRVFFPAGIIHADKIAGRLVSFAFAVRYLSLQLFVPDGATSRNSPLPSKNT